LVKNYKATNLIQEFPDKGQENCSLQAVEKAERKGDPARLRCPLSSKQQTAKIK